MFQGVTGVNAAGDRKPWFEAGRYKVRIDACRGVQSRKGDTFYIVEAEILHIYETDVPDKMKVGRHYGQMIKFNDDMGPINTKRFVLCAMGFDPNLEANQDLVGDDEVNYSVGNDQPFAGLEMELHCELIQTRSGNPFTKHNWFPCEEMMEQEVPPQPQPQTFQGVPGQAMQQQPMQQPVQQTMPQQQPMQQQPMQPQQPQYQQQQFQQQQTQGQPIPQGAPPNYPQGGQQ